MDIYKTLYCVEYGTREPYNFCLYFSDKILELENVHVTGLLADFLSVVLISFIYT